MEPYISVDVETAGPNPADYSLLAIGACRVDAPADTPFYIELQPTSMQRVARAMQVSGLSLERLAAEGVPPQEAMARFAAWLRAVVPDGKEPIFVGHNAPFDWMFVADYFHRYLGTNPFGHSALDLKSLYMGVAAVPFRDTSYPQIAARYGLPPSLSHNALADAQDQARLLAAILRERGPTPGS